MLWTYTYYSADYITLHFFIINYQKIYVYNINNQMKEDNAPFKTLKKLEKVPSEYVKKKDKHLVLGDFNLHHAA